MDKSLIASRSIQINSTVDKLWDVLTKPEKIKTYLFGTEVKTDWRVGSPISFSGQYEGHKYEDKGNVIENKPNELLNYSYWSGFSGLEDRPENYSLVSYRIKKLDDNHCEFTWYQQGFSSEEANLECRNLVDTTIRPVLIDLNEKIMKDRKNWFYKILSPVGNSLKFLVGKPNLTNMDLLTTSMSLATDVGVDYLNHKRKLNELKDEAGLTYLIKLGKNIK